MKKILVLCTGNSCRSQIAEGYLRHFAQGRAVIFSAGIETHGVNPKAVQVMKEDGIDISSHTSNYMNEYAHIDFDYILTVCDNAKESCPYFPSRAIKYHQSFPDPAKEAKEESNEEEILESFRRVRDMIKEYSENFIKQTIG